MRAHYIILVMMGLLLSGCDQATELSAAITPSTVELPASLKWGQSKDALVNTLGTLVPVKSNQGYDFFKVNNIDGSPLGMENHMIALDKIHGLSGISMMQYFDAAQFSSSLSQYELLKAEYSQIYGNPVAVNEFINNNNSPFSCLMDTECGEFYVLYGSSDTNIVVKLLGMDDAHGAIQIFYSAIERNNSR